MEQAPDRMKTPQLDKQGWNELQPLEQLSSAARTNQNPGFTKRGTHALVQPMTTQASATSASTAAGAGAVETVATPTAGGTGATVAVLTTGAVAPGGPAGAPTASATSQPAPGRTYEVIEAGGLGLCSLHSLAYVRGHGVGAGEVVLRLHNEWARRRNDGSGETPGQVGYEPTPCLASFRNGKWAGTDWSNPAAWNAWLIAEGWGPVFILSTPRARAGDRFTRGEITDLLDESEQGRFNSLLLEGCAPMIIIGTGVHWMPVAPGAATRLSLSPSPEPGSGPSTIKAVGACVHAEPEPEPEPEPSAPIADAAHIANTVARVGQATAVVNERFERIDDGKEYFGRKDTNETVGVAPAGPGGLSDRDVLADVAVREARHRFGDDAAGFLESLIGALPARPIPGIYQTFVTARQAYQAPTRPGGPAFTVPGGFFPALSEPMFDRRIHPAQPPTRESTAGHAACECAGDKCAVNEAAGPGDDGSSDDDMPELE